MVVSKPARSFNGWLSHFGDSFLMNSVSHGQKSLEAALATL